MISQWARICRFCVLRRFQVRLAHVSGWRDKSGKNVLHPSQWGRSEEHESISDLEFSKPGDAFNPSKVKGNISMQSSSPFVWTMKGIDPEGILHKTDPSIIRACRSMHASFFPPNCFNFELPKAGVPEIAFCGRSNVGKSTLVGALINNAKLVRASKEPGCTRSINYFGLLHSSRIVSGTDIERAAMYLVDLPGYGFAKARYDDVEKWTMAVENYIINRHCSILRRTFILIDSRHGIKKQDLNMLQLLDDKGVSYQIVLTKADEVKPSDIEKIVEQVMRDVVKHPACYPVVHVVSAIKGQGLDELLNTIYYATGIANANNYSIDVSSDIQ